MIVTARARTLLLRAAIALAVVAGVVWWLRARGHAAGDNAGRGSAAPTDNARAVPVQTATATRRDLPIWLDGLGTVAAVQQVTVRAQVDGRLDKVLFTEGQLVKPGDVLAQIDPRPFQVQLHQALGALARDRAQLDVARRGYERYKGLHDQNLVAEQQVDQLAAQLGQYDGAVKIDQAQIESAQLQLDYAQVKAPIAGITGVRLVDAGNVVHANDSTGIVIITAIDPAAVLFTVPQDRLPQIVAAQARGDKLVVEAYNRDGTKLLGTGKLAVVDNQINQTTATLRLKALIDNPQRVLWPNAFVKARMLVETRSNALVVPAAAVQQGPQGSFVYIVERDTAALRPVTVELQTGEQVVIAKGLDGGERIVIEGQNQLRPGAKVAPMKAGAPRGAGSGGSAAGPTASAGAAPP